MKRKFNCSYHCNYYQHCCLQNTCVHSHKNLYGQGNSFICDICYIRKCNLIKKFYISIIQDCDLHLTNLETFPTLQSYFAMMRVRSFLLKKMKIWRENRMDYVFK